MSSNFSNSAGIIAYSPFNSTEFQFYSSKKVTQNSPHLFSNTDSRKKFVFSASSNSHLPNLVFENLTEIKPEEINPSFECPLALPKNTTSEIYQKQFEKAQHLLSNGSLSKIILSRIIQLDIKDQKIAPLEYFKKLCENNPKSFNYFCYHPSCGLWIGATPETLLKIQDNRLRSTSLAGTRPHFENPPQWRAKEIEEQRMVTDYIGKTFKKHFFGTLKISDVENIFTGSVWHLKTEFEQMLDSSEFDKINAFVQDLHPTPAISGIPKAAALEAIKKIEKHDREYYTGYLGFMEKGSVDLYVNLRCLRWQNDKIALFVGGGITSASKQKEEWDETTNKGRTLLKVFGN